MEAGLYCITASLYRNQDFLEIQLSSALSSRVCSHATMNNINAQRRQTLGYGDDKFHRPRRLSCAVEGDFEVRMIRHREVCGQRLPRAIKGDFKVRIASHGDLYRCRDQNVIVDAFPTSGSSRDPDHY